MNKSELHPVRDKSGLPLDDFVEQAAIRILFLQRLGIVASDDVVGEHLQIVRVLSGGEPLKSADANV